MSDYTYEIPDEKNYMKALMVLLKKDNIELAKFLEGCSCEIIKSGAFSYRRWDAFSTTVHFYVPLDKYENIITFFNDEMKNILIGICDSIMPNKAGLDVKYVDFSPSLEEIQTEKSMIEELEKETLKDIPHELQIKILPSDIIEKAKDMSQAYTFLNIVENTLRLYIDNNCKELLGEDYFTKLDVSRDMKNNIEIRKKDEEKNQWLPIRGDSDIFCFVDLTETFR